MDKLTLLKTEAHLFELQLKSLRDTPESKRPFNYNDQLVNISKRIKELKSLIKNIEKEN